MRALAIGMVYVTAAGLVTLAVERYDYSPINLIGMAAAGLVLILVAVVREDG